MGLKVIKRILRFSVSTKIGGMVSQLEWALYRVRGNVLEIITATIIRNAEGEVLNEIERRKRDHLQGKWIRARKELERCVGRTRKITKYSKKLSRIISIARRAVKLGTKIGRLVPGAGKIIATILVKAEKIFAVIETMLQVIVRVVAVVNQICTQLLAQLRFVRDSVGITEEDEKTAADEAASENIDAIEVFNDDGFDLEIDRELLEYEGLLDDLDSIRGNQTEDECKRRLNDSLTILERIDEFLGEVKSLNENRISTDIDDIDFAIEDTIASVQSTIDKIRDMRDDIETKGPSIETNNENNPYLLLGGNPTPGRPIDDPELTGNRKPGLPGNLQEKVNKAEEIVIKNENKELEIRGI